MYAEAITPYWDRMLTATKSTVRFDDARRSVMAVLAASPEASAGSADIGNPLLLIIVMPRALIAYV